MMVRQITTLCIAEVAWWKTMMPITEELQQKTMLRILVAVRLKKRTPPIAMAVRAKTILHIAMAAR